jgi:1-acyl-sn-glycerol-3-phosphate acyltransferase
MHESKVRLVDIVRSCIAYLFAACYGVVLFLPAIALARVLRTRSPLMTVGLAGVATTLRLAGVRYKIDGKEHVPAHCASVVCVNHTSALDVVAFLALYRLCPRLLILYKTELRSSPLIAATFDAAGFIPIDRVSRDASMRSIEVAVRALRRGESMLVSPEGTRSDDGRLAPFRKGVFLMAITAGVPIIPAAMIGAAEALPKGSVIIRSRDLRLRIGEALETRPYTYGDRDLVIAEIARRIERLLD